MVSLRSYSCSLLALLLLVISSPSEATNHHYQRKNLRVCDRSSILGKISCSTEELYLQGKAGIHSFNQEIKRTYKVVKKNIRYYSHKASGLKLPGLSKQLNNPPVINGNIRTLKYGNGITPLVYVDLPSGFSDSDGTIAKVTWDMGDGTIIELNEGEFSSAGHVRHIYKTSNHYNVSVTVEDDLGLTASKSTYVETPENSEPKALISATSLGDNNVRFNIAATDEDGSTFTYLSYACPWPDTTNQVDCDYLAPGTFNFFSRITDSKGTSIEVSTDVTINGSSISATPVPVIRASTFFGEAPLTVNFDASESFDINGEVVSYRWNFEDWGRPQNSSNDAVTSHTFVKPGTYRVELFVTDDDNIERSTAWEIYVAPTNSFDPQIIATYGGPNTVNFDTSNSTYSVPANNGMFFWDFGDGQYDIGKYMQHTYAASGTYTVKLKLIDINGETHLLQKDITIGSSDDSPFSGHSVSQYEPVIGESVTFDGSSSSDPGQSLPLEYKWVWDDGEQVEDDVVIRSFDERGIYNFELWVTNSRGLSARSSGPLQVREPFSQLDARIAYNPKIGYGPLTVQLDGSLTVSENPIVYREWSRNGSVFSHDEQTEFTESNPGTQYFNYYVKDSLGNESMEFGDARVLEPGSIPSGNLPPVPVMTNWNPEPRKYDFDCFSSTDPDDYVAYCSWKINGKKVMDTQWFSYTFPDDILYTVELTVTDSWGAESTIYRQFDFSSNTNQLITFDYSPIVPVINENMTFGAERTKIPGKDILSYEWDFGDSTSGSGRVVEHTYTSAGNYTVVLTVTDSDNFAHTYSQQINVLATPPAFNFQLAARDSNLSLKVLENETFKTFGAPEKIFFTATALYNAPKPVSEANWDFGDGSTSYGHQVEHTYHKPGTYTVTVTAKDPNGTEFSKNMTVMVERHNGCYASSGETMCLTDISSDNFNVSPFHDIWTLEGDLNNEAFSSSAENYQPGWAKLVSTKGDGKTYDVSSAVNAYDQYLFLNKNKLSREIDLNNPFSLKIVTKSESGQPLIGSWPLHYTGTSTLEINTLELDVKIRLVNPSAQLRKYIDLGSVNSYSFNNLPSGKYAVIAEKGNKKAIQTIELEGEESVTIDLNSSNNLKKLVQRKMANFKFKKSDWSQSLCGESTPFPTAQERILNQGESRIWEFTSADPLATASFREVPSSFNKKIKLSCSIKSPGLLYGQNKWKYKDGPARCWENGKPHFYWNEYLTILEHENSPVVIKYELKDTWTGAMVTGDFVTSAKGLAKESNLTLEDLSAKIGLPGTETSDWGQRVNYEILVPSQFVRPEVRFELYSHHDSSPESLYTVECDVLNHTESPRLASLEASVNSSPNSAEENGRLSLSKKYGLFPVQYDGRSTSPLGLYPQLAKAVYTANINFYERSDITWQGVEVVYNYAGEIHTVIYDFFGAGSLDNNFKIYSNQFIIDTQDLENQFHWVKGESKVNLTVTPLGRETSDYDFRGDSRTYSFTAMFDLQTVNEESSQICENGFYPAELSAFGRDDFLSVLINFNAPNGSVRCGNVSLPFGGPFNLSSSWKFSGHDKGNEGQIRSFNNPELQDDYDILSPTSQKIEDVNAYMDYSQQLDIVMAAQYEEINGVQTDKKKIVDYCNSGTSEVISPCTVGTTFQNITKAVAHEVCLLNSDSGFTPPGCPVADLEKLTRFARWVEINSNSFLQIFKSYPAKATMTTGLFHDLSSQGANLWQEAAFVFGTWPDGMPIFKADPINNIFIGNEINQCQRSEFGCGDLRSLFFEGSSTFDSIVIKTGWN